MFSRQRLNRRQAWPHKDGKGFNLKLDMLPLNGAELVIREPQPDAAAPKAKARKGGAA